MFKACTGMPLTDKIFHVDLPGLSCLQNHYGVSRHKEAVFSANSHVKTECLCRMQLSCMSGQACMRRLQPSTSRAGHLAWLPLSWPSSPTTPSCSWSLPELKRVSFTVTAVRHSCHVSHVFAPLCLHHSDLSTYVDSVSVQMFC